jgi:hypothetical protein
MRNAKARSRKKEGFLAFLGTSIHSFDYIAKFVRIRGDAKRLQKIMAKREPLSQEANRILLDSERLWRDGYEKNRHKIQRNNLLVAQLRAQLERLRIS